MSGPWSYSALRQVLQAAPMQQASPKAWLEYIQSHINKGRVKTTEFHWSGLQEWLDSQGDSRPTKAQLLAQHTLSGIEIKEVVYRNSYDADQTRYGEYQLDGAENYREIILSWMPGNRSNAPLFKSRHWSEPNVLAHIRVNDRRNADGQRILFVEEIQSDWSQLGRRQGLLGRRETQEIIRRERDLDQLQSTRDEHLLNIKTLTNLMSRPLYLRASDSERARMDQRLASLQSDLAQTLQAISAQAARYVESAPAALMGAPFMASTDAWLTLCIKRIAKLAADEGYRGVVFVSQDVVSERFSEDSPDKDAHPGLKTFYADIIPKAAKRTITQIGGYAPYSLSESGHEFHGFEVTPKLKATISSGVPLFSLTKAGSEALFSFAGTSSKLANSSLLQSAMEMLSAGASHERVHFETGWHMGADGQWREEISDENYQILPALASLSRGGFPETQISSLTYRALDDGCFDVTLSPPSPQKTSDFIHLRSLNAGILSELLPSQVIQQMLMHEGAPDYIGNFEDGMRLEASFRIGAMNALPLNEVISHPDLFTAYPQLSSVMVQVDPQLGVNASVAYHDDGTQVIRIGLGQQKSNLIHELQHVIQDIEGFNAGADSAHPHPADLERARLERLQLLRENYEEAKKKHRNSPTRENKDAMKFALQEMNLGEGPPTAADQMNAYLRSAGEVEARNTQHRMHWTAAQRRSIHPHITSDTRKEHITIAGRSDVASVTKAIQSILGPRANSAICPTNGTVRIVTSEQIDDQWGSSLSRSLSKWGPQAYFEPDTGTTYLIADRIRCGSEVSVFLHEMVHKHAKPILGKTWGALHKQVLNWGDMPHKSLERRIFESAHHKATLSGRYEDELVAYATEAAIDFGVTPSAMNARESASGWLAWVQYSFELVIAKLTGFKSEPLTPRELVDFVYAAAQSESENRQEPQKQNAMNGPPNRP